MDDKPEKGTAKSPSEAPTIHRLNHDWGIDRERYWAGVLATAVVAMVAGIVGVIIVEGIFNLTLLPPPVGSGSHGWSYALAGVLATLLAGAAFYFLLLTTPRPIMFFTWIAALITIGFSLAPLAFVDGIAKNIGDTLITGILNFTIGLVIIILLRGVVSRTTYPSGPVYHD